MVSVNSILLRLHVISCLACDNEENSASATSSLVQLEKAS